MASNCKEVKVDRKFAGAIIGLQGSNIKSLKARFEVNITYDRPTSTFTVIGYRREEAAAAILQSQNDAAKRSASSSSLPYNRPSSSVFSHVGGSTRDYSNLTVGRKHEETSLNFGSSSTSPPSPSSDFDYKSLYAQDEYHMVSELAVSSNQPAWTSSEAFCLDNSAIAASLGRQFMETLSTHNVTHGSDSAAGIPARLVAFRLNDDEWGMKLLVSPVVWFDHLLPTLFDLPQRKNELISSASMYVEATFANYRSKKPYKPGVQQTPLPSRPRYCNRQLNCEYHQRTPGSCRSPHSDCTYPLCALSTWNSTRTWNLELLNNLTRKSDPMCTLSFETSAQMYVELQRSAEMVTSPHVAGMR